VPSPFLQRPPSEWVASNALAFAIRDAFPVSPGHTLIIPRREIATWFDATRDEQLAILDLIAAVKHVLDVELAPAGYNVGFNAGAAAGQTVMHLHVHVIPRFEGDLDDPRGGVRHVIPHRGNYLRAGVLPLATGGAKDPFLAHLAPLFARAARIDIVAAFVQDSGLELLGPHLFSAVERGGHVRVLTGDYLGITQVKALERLLGWSRAGTASAAELESGGGFDARVVETREDGGTARSFHP
jgi:diadenosine tetraphosphate (Ap4A) HIT family hydrolase